MTLAPTFASLGAQTLGTGVVRHLHMSLQSCFAMFLNAEDKVELTSSDSSHADSLSWYLGIGTDLPYVGTHWVFGDGWVDPSRAK